MIASSVSPLDIAEFADTILELCDPTSAGTWDCPACTFSNERDRPRCQICRGRRPALSFNNRKLEDKINRRVSATIELCKILSLPRIPIKKKQSVRNDQINNTMKRPDSLSLNGNNVTSSVPAQHAESKNRTDFKSEQPLSQLAKDSRIVLKFARLEHSLKIFFVKHDPEHVNDASDLAQTFYNDIKVLNDALYHKYGHKLKLINLYEEREVLNQYESLVNVSETSDRTRSKSTIKIESKQDMRILLIPAEVLLLYAGDSDQSVDLFQQQFNVTLTLLQTASLLDVGLDNTNLHFRVQGTNQNISELKNCINSIFRETQEVQRVFKSRNNLEDNGGRKNFDKTKNNNMTCKRPRLESSQNLNKSSEDDKKYNTKIGDDSAETNQLLKCLMKKLKCCNDITSCCPSSLAQELLQCHKILSVSVLGVGDIFFKLVGAPSHLTKLISEGTKNSPQCTTQMGIKEADVSLSKNREHLHLFFGCCALQHERFMFVGMPVLFRGIEANKKNRRKELSGLICGVIVWQSKINVLVCDQNLKRNSLVNDENENKLCGNDNAKMIPTQVVPLCHVISTTDKVVNMKKLLPVIQYERQKYYHFVTEYLGFKFGTSI